VNPTFDSMMAAMGWERVGPVFSVDLSLPYGTGIIPPRPPRRLAPRWQVPAIKRRKAGY
jgi:hypothetical protein